MDPINSNIFPRANLKRVAEENPEKTDAKKVRLEHANPHPELTDELLSTIFSFNVGYDRVSKKWQRPWDSTILVSKQWYRVVSAIKKEHIEKKFEHITHVYPINDCVEQLIIDKQFQVANLRGCDVSTKAMLKLITHSQLSTIALHALPKKMKEWSEESQTFVFREFPQWPQLTELKIYKSKNWLRWLDVAPNLKILEISDAKDIVTPLTQATANTVFHSLVKFGIAHHNFDNRDLSFLKIMPRLIELNMGRSCLSIHKKHLAEVLTVLPKLKYLNASYDILSTAIDCMSPDDLIQTLHQFSDLKLECMDISYWWYIDRDPECSDTEEVDQDPTAIDQEDERFKLMYEKIEKEFPHIKFIHEFKDYAWEDRYKVNCVEQSDDTQDSDQEERFF